MNIHEVNAIFGEAEISKMPSDNKTAKYAGGILICVIILIGAVYIYKQFNVEKEKKLKEN